jgi:hypothetical protein
MKWQDFVVGLKEKCRRIEGKRKFYMFCLGNKEMKWKLMEYTGKRGRLEWD